MIKHHNPLPELLTVCHFIAHKDLCPATAGNFSVRANKLDEMWVSGSGRDKYQLTETDFVLCDLNAKLLSGDFKPSDEAVLHGKLYQLSNQIQCVLHTHSIPVTVLSMNSTEPFIRFKGYEMQKTIKGYTTHESLLEIAILDNSQDIPSLAKQLEAHWSMIIKASGFIVKGHGLYSWGHSIFEAKRHMEGIEFLMACELERRRLRP